MSHGFARINVDAAQALILVPYLCRGNGCTGHPACKMRAARDAKAVLR
jgi:hypothetical protein